MEGLARVVLPQPTMLHSAPLTSDDGSAPPPDRFLSPQARRRRTAALPEIPPVLCWFARGPTVPGIIRDQAREWLDGFVAFRLARRGGGERSERQAQSRQERSAIELRVGAWDAVDPWVGETLRRPDRAKDAQRRARRAVAALATHALAARRRLLARRPAPQLRPTVGSAPDRGEPPAWDDTIPDEWVLRAWDRPADLTATRD